MCAWLHGTALLVACAGGFFLGRAATVPDEPRGKEQGAGEAACVSMDSKLDEQRLRADIRRVLREELSAEVDALAHAPAQGAPSDTQQEDEEDREPLDELASAAQEEAAIQGQRIVEAALQKRQWTENDVAAIRDVLPKLSAEQKHALLQTLVPAINTGRVSLSTLGELF